VTASALHDADAVAAVVAVYAGAHLGDVAPPGWLLVAIVLAGALAFRRSPAIGIACVLLASSAVLTVRAVNGVDHAVAIPPTATITLLSDPVTRGFTTSVIGRTRGHRVLVSASSTNGSRLGVLTAGDGVTIAGRARPLDGFARRYRWQHVVARVSVRDVLAVRPAHNALTRLSNALRDRVLAGVDVLPGPVGALDAGFLLGDTRAIDPRVDGNFRRAGLSHLLAVSGANVAFALGLAGPLLRRSSLATRFITGAVVLVVFGAMTRWQPSVLRAVAMALVALTAQWAGRPVSSLRLLCIAGTALILIDPFLVHSVGFGLSCGACAGIALIAHPIERHLRGPRWVREAGAVTLAAQIGVAPILIPVFGALPLVAVPANLVAAPAVGPLTICGLVGGVAGGALRGAAPALARVVQLPVIALVRYIASVAAVAARVSVAIGPRAALALVAVVTAIAAIIVLAGGGPPRHRQRSARRLR
jgi:competence protein ComEC